MVDASGMPLAVHTCSARLAEVTLVYDTLDASFGMLFSEQLIGDKAYDSAGLDAELASLGIEMIAPHRRDRRKTQGGRPLRRYRRRWKVERTIAWLQSFRRVRTRDEVKGRQLSQDGSVGLHHHPAPRIFRMSSKAYPALVMLHRRMKGRLLGV